MGVATTGTTFDRFALKLPVLVNCADNNWVPAISVEFSFAVPFGRPTVRSEIFRRKGRCFRSSFR